ncbi:unnamed protein product [Clonostachys rosea]|uniref:Uncharacterized protein n=1 Tax=Bionectria ochroleuca TaxID=29856 RepID=A0ABY6V3Z2_BIOOC|nr:unnamed protein product [Clonostachys rosea]
MKGVALVTGAASGIGEECAKSFVEEGCVGVIFADIDLDRAEEAAESALASVNSTSARSRVLALKVDVSDPTSVDSMVSKAVGAFGRIDYCVHSAGVGAQQPSSILNMSSAEFEDSQSINITGTFNVIKAVGRQMVTQTPLAETTRRGAKMSRGSIVALASCHSFAAARNLSQYITSKHAVLGLTRSAALDLASHGIRVNAVCPGWVDTPMVSKAASGIPEIRNYIEKLVPFGRMAETQEVSEVVLFLSSSRASFVTGAAWVVDGGLTRRVFTSTTQQFYSLHHYFG